MMIQPIVEIATAVSLTLVILYGGSRVLIDASLTAGFDETRSLLIAVGWLATLLGAAALLLRCTARRTT